jgi:YYY domain-containing protein
MPESHPPESSDAIDTQEEAAAGPALPSAPEALPARRPGLVRRYRTALIEAFCLGAIVVFGLYLRFTGITWGTGYYLHPDELFLSSVVDSISAPVSLREYFSSQTSPLNPFNHDTGYVYGTLPLFLAKLLGSFTEYTSIANNHVPGRWLSAIADTGTIVVVWWVGRMLWNRWVGLLAALLLAVTVLHIQGAHFFTTDSWSALFATATFAFALAAWKYRAWSLYALAGLMLGLAGASKPTVLAAVGFLFLPALETIRLEGWSALWPRLSLIRDESTARQPNRDRAFPVLLATILAGLIAVWTFRVAQPYTFAGPSPFSFRLDPRWLEDIQFWQLVQSGQFDYPPSHQWTERTPILFHVRNLVLWGMGPGLGIAALAGFGWICWRLITARQWPTWTLLMPAGWIAFHLVYFGVALTKTMRYLLPAYPLLVVCAAGLLGALAAWGWQRGALHVSRLDWSWRPPRWCHPGVVLPVLVVASTILYAVAFVSIYQRPHSRVAASEWIVENIPDGSTIASEYWDSGLPVGIPEQAGHSWVGVTIAPYDDENEDKLNRMIGVLQQSDYVILSSNRLIDSIARLPWRYPMANAYYDALLSGELGFEQVAQFTSFPALFGVELDDRGAEEAFTVYDHPQVRIFRKTDAWDPHAAWTLLNNALGHGGLSIRPVQTQPDRMMLDQTGQDAVREASGWDTVFSSGTWSNRLAPLTWYLALQVLAFAALPLCWRLLGWLPDRGYALSKTLGVFLVAWITWWLASAGPLAFGPFSIAGAWLAVLAASLVLVWRARDNFVHDLRERLPWIVATELVLGAGYTLALIVRAGNPDLWLPTRVGSQLQDMAAFTATVFSPSFPVYDPWLVDGVIHDFTFGLTPWAVLTRLTGIEPNLAYSLALGTLAALVMLNAWALVSLLMHRLSALASTRSVILGGLGGALACALLGSWGMAQRVATNDWSANFAGTPGDAIRGTWQVLVSSFDLPPGAWWTVTSYVGTGALEVPLTSFLTNELAPHQAGLPVLLAAIAVTVGFLTRDRSEEAPGGAPLATLGAPFAVWPWLGVAGIVTGWTLATNPLFGVVVLIVLAMVLFLTRAAQVPHGHAWWVVRDWGVTMVVVGASAVVAIWPFLQMYGTFATLREPLAQALDLGEVAGLLGSGLAIVLGWLVIGVTRSFLEGTHPGWPARVVTLLLLGVALGLAWVVGLPVLFIPIVLLAVGLVAWHAQHLPLRLTILGLVAVALIVSLIGSLYQFESWTQQRNIPLAFQLASWLLLVVVASTIIAGEVIRLTAPDSVIRRGARVLALVGAVVLAGPGLVYPVVAIPQQHDDRLVDQSPSLDAIGFMATGSLDQNANGQPVAPYSLAADLAAITWMRQSISGLPTMVESPANGSGWGGRVSALTGFPTVVGSVPVELAQRPGMDRLVNWRAEDVRTLYTSTGSFTSVEPILVDYGIELIYVGPLERATYGEAGLAKFDDAVETGDLERVYAEDGVAIYVYSGIRDSREPGS